MIFEKQIRKAYESKVFTRCEKNTCLYYYSADDFYHLNKSEYSFVSSRGLLLKGYFYYYDNPINDRLLVFDHGMGPGHTGYMKEIERLCRHGFLVYAYDHTGCDRSQGDNINGMAQSLCDLNDCLNVLEKDENLKNRKISVMGHSWGGYSCLNIGALHDVDHIVAISGFMSVKAMIRQEVSGILAPCRSFVYHIEKEANPIFYKFNAIKSLKNTKAKVLIIHSADDGTVKPEFSFYPMREALQDRDNIEFMLVDGKKHNPNYTKDAVDYMSKFFKDLRKENLKRELETEKLKKQFRKKYDFDRMTKQDDKIWDKILTHLDS